MYTILFAEEAKHNAIRKLQWQLFQSTLDAMRLSFFFSLGFVNSVWRDIDLNYLDRRKMLNFVYVAAAAAYIYLLTKSELLRNKFSCKSNLK